MSILRDIQEKIKEVPRKTWDDITIVVIILLVALASFGLGRLSIITEKGSDTFQVVYPEGKGDVRGVSTSATQEAVQAPEGGYVASKTGAKYHLPWCAGAQAIKESNKIYFATKAEAEAAGYTPAANCKGI